MKINDELLKQVGFVFQKFSYSPWGAWNLHQAFVNIDVLKINHGGMWEVRTRDDATDVGGKTRRMVLEEKEATLATLIAVVRRLSFEAGQDSIRRSLRETLGVKEAK